MKAYCLSLLILLAASPVLAEPVLDLDRVYGNDTGCRVFAGGDYSSDDKFLLKADSYEAHESACEFVEVLRSRTGAKVVKTLCQGEGSYWVQSIVISPPDPENDTLLVFFDDGALWHEVKPCS